MAIIYSYPLNDNIKPLDELVGTTEKIINGQLKTVTRNFLLQDLAEFFIVDGGLQKEITLTTEGDEGPSTLDQVTGILNIPQYAGLQNLQQVTEEGATTTNSITAASFIKQGGTGTNILLDDGDTIALSSIGGNTNLSTSQTANNFTINSDTGDDALVPLGNGTLAGATLNDYTTAEKNKLAAITGTNTGDQNLQQVTDEDAITTNSITAASFIKQGGAPTQFLMGDGSVTIGNGGVYSYEIHVSQVDGNDTTGTGAVLNPVATITKALTLITGERRTIIIHPGNYTESPNITVQYTVLTSLQSIGGNTLISGTVSTNTGCTISGLKMTNLTINGVTGRGNINILNCDISGTFTKNGTADYTLIRFCDIGAVNIVSSAGVLAVLGGNLSFITVNSVGASILVKNAVCISPAVLIGSATFADCILISTAPTTNALTTSAGTNIVLANSQCVIPTFQGVARVSLSGFYSIFNVVFDKPNSTLVASSGTGGTTNSIDYFQFINADKFIKQGGTSSQILAANGDSITAGTNITISGGTISSTGGEVSVSLSAIGSVPNANAATLTGSVLNLQPASDSFGGVITTGTQTFAGAKTFTGTISASNLSGTNTGDQNLSGYALLASPTFTGTPSLPTGTIGVTQVVSNNSTRLATTEYVDRQVGLGGPAYNIIISSFPGNTITTETNGASGGVSYSQNGRNVMINNGATAITVAATVASTPTDFIASYTKIGSATITFTFTGTGAVFITPNGAVLSGDPGSTALLTKNGSTVYLLINNIT